MDKYRKVEKPRDTLVPNDEEIRVTALGSVSTYVSRAGKVFNELNKPQVVIKATGNALTKAVTLAEVVKRRFKGLHQITSVGSTQIVDEYEPLEEGLDRVTDTRTVSVIEIQLSKEPLDASNPGYQAPIDESLVSEFDPEELAKPRGRGRGQGRGFGKGRGKGKGKGKGDEHDGEDREDRADREERPKGKGKGKGKGKKGEGKGDGKGDEGFKGKGKGKGKKGDGKGDEGKGKGKSSKGGNWDDAYPPLGGGKGKGSQGKGYGSYGGSYKGGSKGGEGEYRGWNNWNNSGYNNYNRNQDWNKGW